MPHNANSDGGERRPPRVQSLDQHVACFDQYVARVIQVALPCLASSLSSTTRFDLAPVAVGRLAPAARLAASRRQQGWRASCANRQGMCAGDSRRPAARHGHRRAVAGGWLTACRHGPHPTGFGRCEASSTPTSVMTTSVMTTSVMTASAASVSRRTSYPTDFGRCEASSTKRANDGLEEAERVIRLVSGDAGMLLRPRPTRDKQGVQAAAARAGILTLFRSSVVYFSWQTTSFSPSKSAIIGIVYLPAVRGP
jgi:hypothetical protein